MRIAIVNDMLLAVAAIRRVLAADGRHTVAWVARDGAEAVQRCADDTPDLILMDLIMPVMDGAEATRLIMAGSPCAILVVTATVEGNAQRVYEALGGGALDVVETPNLVERSGLLLAKLDMMEKRIHGARPEERIAIPYEIPPVAETARTGLAGWLVAVGASAGGPAALAQLLSGLTADFPGAVVIVQHIDAAFCGGLVIWLTSQCRLPVSLAVDGERPLPGHVYLAGGDKHLVVDSSGCLARRSGQADGIYLPSIDVLFESMARHWKRAGTGVLLTGMGRDGAQGLLSLRNAGFSTIAQDRGSSAVYGMPKAAAELKAATDILPLARIAPHLQSLARSFVP